MGTVINLFPGVYQIQAETDPAKIEQNKKKHLEWKEKFEMAYQTLQEFGSESREHQWAMIQYKKWQQQRSKA